MTNPVLVRRSDDDGVATITLDSPHNRNALSDLLVTQLMSALATAEADQGVRAVLLAADGPVFCSGADLSEAADGGMERGARQLIALQRQLVASGKPVVLRLHGPVRAGGLGLVAAADIAIAADTVSFAFTEARLGLAPAVISPTTTARMTNRSAARAFLTAESFDAAAAARVGLISQAVPPQTLDDAVADTMRQLTAGSPQGLRESKRLLNAALLADLDDRGEQLARLSASLFGSAEAKEAMRAFLASRKR